MRAAVVASVLVLVACTSDPAPEPTSSPTPTDRVSTSSKPTQASTPESAPVQTSPALEEAFTAPERIEGEVARVTYFDGAAVSELTGAPDLQIGYQIRASCHGNGSITPELWVNGVKASGGVTWECSDELPAAVNVDAAVPPLKSVDDVQIRFSELTSGQEAWAVLEPAIPIEG